MKNLLRKLIGVLSIILFVTSSFAQSSVSVVEACAEENVVMTVKVDQSKLVDGVTAEVEWLLSGIEDNTAVGTTVERAYPAGGTYQATVTITYVGGTNGTPAPETLTKQFEVYSRPNVSFGDATIHACTGEVIELSYNDNGNDYGAVWSIPLKEGKSITVSEEELAASNDTYKDMAEWQNVVEVTVYRLVERAGKTSMFCERKHRTKLVFHAAPVIQIAEEPNGTPIAVGEEIVWEKTYMPEGKSVFLSLESGVFDGVKFMWDKNESVTPIDNGKWGHYKLKPVKPSNGSFATYMVTAQQTHGSGSAVCEATKELLVEVDIVAGNEETPFDANNVFTPNEVNNHAWKLHKEGEKNELAWYKDCELIIYNTWGQEVYGPKVIGELPGFDMGEIWDGTSNDGDELPTDAYYYLVKCKNCSDCGSVNNNYTGTVTILRK